MGLLIGLLTFVLVLNSVLLILLILVQLPKKEAGAGLAFGGVASDALFGAGSGTVLTRLTKYATGVFLCLSLLLSILHNHRARSTGRTLASELDKKAGAAVVMPAPVSGPATNAAAMPVIPKLTTTSTNLVPAATSAPVAPPVAPPTK